MAENAEKKAEIEKHGISPYLRDCLALLLENRPSDPLFFLAEYFSGVVDGSSALSRALRFLRLARPAQGAWGDNVAMAFAALDGRKGGVLSSDLFRLLSLFSVDGGHKTALLGALGADFGQNGETRVQLFPTFSDCVTCVAECNVIFSRIAPKIWQFSSEIAGISAENGEKSSKNGDFACFSAENRQKSPNFPHSMVISAVFEAISASKTAQNGQKSPKMAQNGPKMPILSPNRPKIGQNGSKSAKNVRETLKNGAKMAESAHFAGEFSRILIEKSAKTAEKWPEMPFSAFENGLFEALCS
eukprot:TRINITY_DN1475_c0_g1_i2.p1 TRINITY_DN1475_c0_g1~~TRINITY_DN1475_c0_g1_i2.p1  ORF type:complete len:301 (-),score=59.43 TRINITY_DN1475_c0_g1_i2:44-946(-)